MASRAHRSELREKGVVGSSSKNAVNQMKAKGSCEPIKNAVAMCHCTGTKGGYKKIKGAVSG